MESSQLVSFDEWKQNFLSEIEILSNTTKKGDVFVQKVLQIYYGLSETDAINATDSAGAGDKGVDAIHISDADEHNGQPEILVVQGKYGTAGSGLHVYNESMKFFDAVNKARTGQSITPSIDKVASAFKNGAQVRYVIATVESLSTTQKADLDNVAKLATHDFGDNLIVEAKHLGDLYDAFGGDGIVSEKRIKLDSKVVEIQRDVFVGAASIADLYAMMRKYSELPGCSVDSIYDRNIRKYLKRKKGSVNDGIYSTLDKTPERFIAYNNGITIICDSAKLEQEVLELVNPYIVNGCQTTRTLYDLMSTKFPGIIPWNDTQNKMADYRNSYLSIRVLPVGGVNDSEFANNVTRFSNKQTAVRGRDFISLDDMYKKLKKELMLQGYYLETQTGEYDALSKAQQQKYPKTSHLINSFEATLAYAASILEKPYNAFGRSAEFTPGGEEYDNVVENLSGDDLLIPWQISGYASQQGYTKVTQRNPQPGTEHRAQTRYFFLFLFFRLTREALTQVQLPIDKNGIYKALHMLIEDYKKTPDNSHAFATLLQLTDDAVATYMDLAEQQKRYTDRNSFLKRVELIDETFVTQALAATKRKLQPIGVLLKKLLI